MKRNLFWKPYRPSDVRLMQITASILFATFAGLSISLHAQLRLWAHLWCESDQQTLFALGILAEQMPGRSENISRNEKKKGENLKNIFVYIKDRLHRQISFQNTLFGLRAPQNLTLIFWSLSTCLCERKHESDMNYKNSNIGFLPHT